MEWRIGDTWKTMSSSSSSSPPTSSLSPPQGSSSAAMWKFSPSFAPSLPPASSSPPPAVSSPPVSQSTKDFPPLPGSVPPARQPPVQVVRSSQPQAPSQQPSSTWDAETEAKYGLRGLMDSQRLQSPEALLTCGVNLGPTFEQQQRNPDAMISSFLKRQTQPQNVRNAEVFRHVQPLQMDKIPPQEFTDEVLLFMFYAMPRDRMQREAAQALSSHGWFYYTELQTWMKRTPNVPPVRLDQDWERGSWQFFDVSEWRLQQKDDLINLRCLQGQGHSA